MSSSFEGQAMAAGYARSRPAVHPRVLELVRTTLQWKQPFARALDVGCGSGLSTAALDGVAVSRTGIEPVHAMTALAGVVAPGAQFCTGAAEAMPFRAASFDLLAAAGSLNYADLDRFWPEALRVLTPGGMLLVYDFSPGRSFADGSPALERWFESFVARFPYPAGDATALDPAILARIAQGFRVVAAEEFRIPLRLTPRFYLEYMLTETNVAACVDEARVWCTETLASVWAGRPDAEVLFSGYFAVLAAAL